jgi:alkylhydroperoxidase family enzyme
VPNVFLAYAWKPDHFRVFCQFYDALMRASSFLLRAERERTPVEVSGVNSCTY